MAETLPGAMAQPFSNPLSQFTENVGAGVKAELDIERQVAEAKKKELAPLIAEDRAKRDEFAGRQKEVTQQMTKPFEVPQPMMADFASLGGMLAVTASMLGGAGKQPAMQAMAAMTGVLDGFQKGRKDLVDRSFKEFDANMKRLQALQKAIDVELSAWAEKAKLGREDANLNLEVAAALVKNGSAEGLIRGKTADSIFKYMQHQESLSAAQTRAQQQIDARRDEFDRSNIIVNSQTGEQGYVSSRDGKFHKLDVPQGYVTQKKYESMQTEAAKKPEPVIINNKPMRWDAAKKDYVPLTVGGEEAESFAKPGTPAKPGKGTLPGTAAERNEYTSRVALINNIDDIMSLLDNPKYSKLITPSTKFTPEVIQNLKEGYPELAQKLARIEAIEFSIGGKSLTASEQKILAPLYQWRGLTADALRKKLEGTKEDFERSSQAFETYFSGLKEIRPKLDEIYRSTGRVPSLPEPGGGNIQQDAIQRFGKYEPDKYDYGYENGRFYRDQK